MTDRANLPGEERSRVQAVTLWEPWASLIASGVKWIETRSWATKYRGSLAIHAAARPVREKLVLGDYEAWPADAKSRPHPNHPDGRPPRLYCNKGPWLSAATWRPLAFGAVIATADLVDCVPIYGEDRPPMGGSFVGEFAHDGDAPHQTGGLWLIGVNGKTHGHPTRVEDQRPYGDFTPGRWAWLLDNVERIDPPIPARGRQQLWKWADPRVRASDEEAERG